MCSSPNMVRPALTRRRMRKRWSKNSLAPNGEAIDEIHFHHWRRGQFVRQRIGGCFPWNVAGVARIARRLPEVRPVSECRSGNDESVSTRRSLRVERWRRDRSRSWPLRAFHELRPLAREQPNERPGLRESYFERAP